MRFLCIAAFLLFPRFSWAQLEVDEGLFTAPDVGLTIRLPPEWTASDQTGFPDIRLVLKVPATDAVISVTTGRIPAEGTIASFVAENRKGMEAIGMSATPARRGKVAGFTGWIVEATTASKRRSVRQLYVPHLNHVLIFTLACDAKSLETLAKELTYILKGAELGQPQGPGETLPQVTDTPIM